MDLRQYFRKLREVEAGLPEEYTVLASVETPDGGKAGVIFEVERSNAARMIVEGCAVPADEHQIAEYRSRQIAARKASECADLAKRIQLAIVNDSDLPVQIAAKRGNGTLSGK